MRLLLLLIVALIPMFADNKEVNSMRRAGNANAFYPGSCQEIEKMISHFNSVLDDALKDKSILNQKTRAIISPHAGYIYSGFTANIAHRLLGNANPKRVIVIGPSHHVYFEGISVSLDSEYESPCGNLEIDREYISKLAKRYSFISVREAHFREHSTETQIPFIKHYLPNAKVVELIYGKIDYKELIPLIKDLLADSDNGIVISSDLSHFYTLDEAKKLDNICLAGVAKEDVNILKSGCEACGLIGIEAMVESAKELGYRAELLDYRTSADASGDKSRVVGYMSAIFIK